MKIALEQGTPTQRQRRNIACLYVMHWLLQEDALRAAFRSWTELIPPLDVQDEAPPGASEEDVADVVGLTVARAVDDFLAAHSLPSSLAPALRRDFGLTALRTSAGPYTHRPQEIYLEGRALALEAVPGEKAEDYCGRWEKHAAEVYRQAEALLPNRMSERDIEALNTAARVYVQHKVRSTSKRQLSRDVDPKNPDRKTVIDGIAEIERLL